MAKKKTSTVSTRLLTATMIIFFLLSGSVLCILASTFTVTINYSMNNSWITFIFVVFVLSLTCAIFLLVTSKKKNDENTSQEDKDKKKDDRRSDRDDSVKKSVIARMNQNLVRIKEYYEWSQDQAKAMFIVAVITCIAGFGMIVASLLLSIYLKLNFEAALFTAIGGMVTEVFGGTTLLIFRNTVSQLNYYHRSLHEDQRYLFTSELTEEINSSAIKDEMLEAIIRNALRINLVLAQEKEESVDKKKPTATENEKPGTADAEGQEPASNAGGSEEKPKKP
ncbi:MAG TPA: hypothetical protein VN417_04590 [Candidatus Cryosericum sp.]|nr:hypothetical protein [Candidatus Cryosericum sp.]